MLRNRVLVQTSRVRRQPGRPSPRTLQVGAMLMPGGEKPLTAKPAAPLPSYPQLLREPPGHTPAHFILPAAHETG